MGIIQKQAQKSTIINFIGIGFGSVTRFLMPFVLEKSQIGILALLDTLSGVYVVALNFGYNLILKKLFPKYRNDENGHSGFLALGIILSILGSAIGFGTFYLIDGRSSNSLLEPFLFLIPILILFRILFVNLDGYVRMLFKTVIGTFLDGFLSKIVFLVAIILYIFSFVSLDYFVYLYCLALSLPGVITIFYAFFITKKITLPTTELLGESKKMRSYVLFGILAGSSSAIIQYIDVLMIEYLTPINPEAEVGVYSIMFFAAILIAIPAKNLSKISAVILSESWKNNDLKNIADIYTKSASNLLIIGGYLFIVGWACIDPVLHFLPEYAYAKYVFFFLGIAKLIELSTGVNTEIIDTSEKYKYNTYFNILLAILVFTFNYVFIFNYGIIGAAFASLLAMTIVNALRAILLYKAYKLWPFNFNFYKTALFCIVCISIVSSIQYNVNPILKIVLNFSIITIAFWTLVVALNLSSDISEKFRKLKNRIIK